MSRRRLRLICSSDEEEEENQIPQQPEPENQNRDPNVVLDPYPSEPLEISDDDVEEEESSTSPITSILPIRIRIPITTPHSKLWRRIPPVKTRVSDESAQPNPAAGGGEQDRSGAGFPVGDFLGRLGLRLKNEWLEACLETLRSSVPSFASLGVDAKAKLCFERFLVSDMNQCGNGVIPRNVDSMHLVDLPGPFVLQVAICNVHIRHGLLMLVPEAFEVLGGLVEELEAARL